MFLSSPAIKSSFTNLLRKLRDVSSEHSILTKRCYGLTHCAGSVRYRTGWLQRESIFQTLRCANQLYGQHVLRIGDDLAQFERSRHAHGNMILFSSGCGNTVHTGGMRKNLRFIQQGRSCHMRDHKTGGDTRIPREKWGKPFVDVWVDETVDATLADADEVRERN